MSILSNLNESQSRAAGLIDGPLKIIAGAGTGKTRTISYRAAYMIESGINPKNILMLTFTNKAAKEIVERARSVNSKSSRIIKGTFHAICLKILKNEIRHLDGFPDSFTIYDTSDQISVIKDCLRTFKSEKAFCAKAVQAMISNYKNSGHEDGVESYFEDEGDPYHDIVIQVYPLYQEKMNLFAALDFDDILLKVVDLLKKNEDIRKKYDEHFKYVIVDEYQDTNGVQLSFLRLINRDNNNICVVGDDDQSIYSFRGAVVENILNFEDYFPGGEVVKLEDNYRSNDKILNLSNAVISENTKRSDKKLKTDNISEIKPKLYIYDSTGDEVNSITDEIKMSLINGDLMPKDIAIISRGSILLAKIEEQLILNGDPYRVYGGQKIKDRSEIKDILAYLQVTHNPKDEVALRRIINTPNRGVGKKTIDKLAQRSKETGRPMLEVIKDYPHLGQKESLRELSITINTIKEISRSTKDVGYLINAIINHTNYEDHINKTQDSPKKAEKKKNSINFFSEMGSRYYGANGEFCSLKKFIENLTLVPNEEEEEENCISLMTIHASKGLEFKRVYIPFCQEGVLPHKRSIESGGVEEERRLMYVAITRAKEELIISYSKNMEQYGKMKEVHPSRFIIEKDELFEVRDKTSFDNIDDGDWGSMLIDLAKDC
jgi:ATP-dependent DNA helicase Rep/DNA helicase-2/ATP-dependent DNA helicase PcrA